MYASLTLGFTAGLACYFGCFGLLLISLFLISRISLSLTVFLFAYCLTIDLLFAALDLGLVTGDLNTYVTSGCFFYSSSW